MNVDFGARSCVADSLPAVIELGVGHSVAIVVKVVLVEEEATIVAWVVNEWLEAANVGVNQGMNNWLCHFV